MGHDVSLCAQELWEDIEAVRRTGPLVHNITNLVVMSLSANVLLERHDETGRQRYLTQRRAVRLGFHLRWVNTAVKVPNLLFSESRK